MINVLNFGDMVFFNDSGSDIAFGILQDYWEQLLSEHSIEGLKWSHIDLAKRYYLLTPSYFHYYKTGARGIYNGECYSPDIIDFWKNGKTEKIVRDTFCKCGFMYDLDGEPISRWIWAHLYSDSYFLDDCLEYAEKNSEFFAYYEKSEASCWSYKEQVLHLAFIPGDELTEVVSDWQEDLAQGIYSSRHPECYYINRHFSEFKI